MRLRSLTLYYLKLRLKKPFTTSFGTERFRHVLLLEVQETGGEVGWGEVVADGGPWYSYETVKTSWHVIVDYLSKLIRGRDVTPRNFLELVGRVRGHRMAKAGVEFALWDLEGRLTGKPVWRLLGGVRREVEVGLSVGVIGDAKELIREVSYGLERGFRRIKLKIAPGWDVEVVKLVRREFGDIPLQVDANAAYELEDIGVLKALDEFNLLMIEQPLHYEDLVDHAELQKQLRTPICLDESIRSLRDVRAAIKLGSCRVINIKPGRVGGLSESLGIHDYCASRGVPVWIGGLLETGVGRSYAVALATLPNVKYPSDISPSSRFWVEDLVEPPWELRKGGVIEAPEKPGIGVEVREGVVKKYLVKARRISFS